MTDFNEWLLNNELLAITQLEKLKAWNELGRVTSIYYNVYCSIFLSMLFAVLETNMINNYPSFRFI